MININQSLRSGCNSSKIHELTLRILNEIGIPIQSERTIEILHTAGCRIDKLKRRVYIPQDVVDRALHTAVPRYGLFDRSGDKRTPIGDDHVSFMSGAAAIRVKDLDGIYRSPTLKDLSDMTRIQTSLENIDVIHELVEPEDIDPSTMRVLMAATVLKNTDKPCAFVVDGPEDVEDMHRMGVAIRGTEKTLREKPLFSIHDISAEATLGIVDAQCDALIRCAELGIPTGTASYPIMGTTGPVSLEGSLALANANVLCGLTISQTVNPGTPFLYMIMAGSMDMHTADMVTAAPEINAYYLAGKCLADHYRLPSHCIVSADSKSTDIQLAIEKYTALTFAVHAGINLIHGSVCQSDSMNGAHYEQLLIDNELIGMIKRAIDICGHNGSDEWYEEVFHDIQRSLSSNMYFLDSDMTLREFKKTLWESSILVRKNFDSWKNSDMKGILDNSAVKTQELLENFVCDPLDVSVEREIDGIVKHAVIKNTL
jgi:trimethylamine--corrinoid protein Co-methyltransferase